MRALKRFFKEKLRARIQSLYIEKALIDLLKRERRKAFNAGYFANTGLDTPLGSERHLRDLEKFEKGKDVRL